MSREEQMSLLCQFFTHHCVTAHDVDVPNDFLRLSVCAMQNLVAQGKLNVLYELAKGFGTMRPDQLDTCFPMMRMPFGMIEYMAAFFNSTPGSKVRCNKPVTHYTIIILLQVFCPTEYEDWLQTMYVLFGTKFAKIFCGPMWSCDVTNQSMDTVLTDVRDPLQVINT